VTQEQILSLVAIALFVNLFLISLAVGFSRRGRNRSAPAAAAIGPAVALGKNGSGPVRAEGTPMTGPGATMAFAIGDRRPGAEDLPGPGAAALPVAGIDDPVIWTRVTAAEAARIARYHRAATIVLVELDGLDHLVESLGPVAGERVVAATAATIRAEARTTDTVARLGPHRFGVLLPETDEVETINYTERVRAICDRWLQSGAVALRVAIGFASLTAELGPAGAMRLAQGRLDSERRPNLDPAQTAPQVNDDPVREPSADGKQKKSDRR
jgi:diguanylate cyclase (GGDEF)-like protein